MNSNLRKLALFFTPTAWLVYRWRALRRWSGFRRTFAEFTSKADRRFPIKWSDRKPYLNDNTPDTGFDTHYVYHTAWAARQVAL
jgi:hypothetical protein